MNDVNNVNPVLGRIVTADDSECIYYKFSMRKVGKLRDVPSGFRKKL